jgi:hypothetical protein
MLVSAPLEMLVSAPLEMLVSALAFSQNYAFTAGSSLATTLLPTPLL